MPSWGSGRGDFPCVIHSDSPMSAPRSITSSGLTPAAATPACCQQPSVASGRTLSATVGSLGRRVAPPPSVSQFNCLIPVWAPLLGVVFLAEEPRPRQIAAVILGASWSPSWNGVGGLAHDPVPPLLPDAGTLSCCDSARRGRNRPYADLGPMRRAAGWAQTRQSAGQPRPSGFGQELPPRRVD